MSSSEDVRTVYKETCASYHRIDDFRAKLLALIPTVSGVAIFYLVRNSTAAETTQIEYVAPAALFGLLVSFGLYLYELRGVQRCIQLAKVAKELESEMSVNGQFTQWPRSIGRFINEPIAAAIIYPAMLSSWTYLAAKPYLTICPVVLALAVFLFGFFGGWIFYGCVRSPYQ